MDGLAKFLRFRDPSKERYYLGGKRPWNALIEDYFAEKIDITGDMVTLCRRKAEFCTYKLTGDQYKFFITHFIPEVLIHSKALDKELVTYHYDIGNDFFEANLGPMMIYTSAFFHKETETLEQAQQHKLEMISKKMKLAKGHKYLDIGCGWGTLLRHASRVHGTRSTGVTLSGEQVNWINERIKKEKLEKICRVVHADYRDTPVDKYDRISCIEMAEHVGVRKFQRFMRQVSSLLKDDGIFYLQIAGLRRNSDWEDINWGLFMNRYIFRGADASLPLSFVVNNLEKAGFEIHSVENVGIHYSLTIARWHKNWLKNKDKIVKKYGERLYRIWNVFLAWSVLIAENGGSTCFQIVCNKNKKDFNRRVYIGKSDMGEARN